MKRIVASAAIAFLALVVPAQASTIDLSFRGLDISVSDSWTAQVFHIVDQLSAWDQYAHKQYGRWAAKALDFTERENQLLKKHAALRQARGWGKGFEQAFLVEESIEDAASRAVELGLLSKEEAESEKEILLHFAPRLLPLRDERRSQIEAFKQRLLEEQEGIRPIVERLAKFAESGEQLKVPVFLVSNTEETSAGGGANGGRIVVEVPGPEPMSVLLHESLHALLKARSSDIAAAAESAGLSFSELNEGIAYAMAPGLTDDVNQADRLVGQLARYLMRGTPSTDAYVRTYMVAGIIRPLLRAALENGQTFTQFLPGAAQEWRKFNGR